MNSILIRFAHWVLGTMVLIARVSPQTWTTSGPFGGPVSTFEIDPHFPDHILAGLSVHGGPGEVFVTEDDGTTWSRTFLSGRVVDIAISEKNPEMCYMLVAATAEDDTLSGIYRSENSGRSWSLTSLKNITGLGLREIELSPGDANELFVPSTGGSASYYHSLNGGATWDEVLVETGFSEMWDLAITPGYPDTMFAMIGSSILRTRDGSKSWSVVFEGYDGRKVAVSPHNPQIVFAALKSQSDYRVIWRSLDGGETWESTAGWLPYSSALLDIAFHPTDSLTVYIMNVFRVRRTTNLGESWRNPWSMLGEYGGVTAFRLHQALPDTVLFSKEYVGVSKMHVDGGEWVRIGVPASSIDALHSHHITGYGLLAADNTAFHVLEYETGEWKSFNFEAEILQTNVIESSWFNPGRIVLGGETGFFGPFVAYSLNGGGRWTYADLDLPFSGDGRVTCVESSPLVPGHFISNIDGLGPTAANLSWDGGVNWENLETVPERQFWTATDYSDSLKMYMSGDGVWKTVDGGLTWTPLPFPDSNWVSFVKLSPTNSQILIATTDRGVYRSEDEGNSWVNVRPPIIEGTEDVLGIDVSQLSSNHIIALFRDGTIILTEDGGASWRQINHDLDTLRVTAVEFHPEADGIHIYAGTEYGGVWHLNNFVILSEKQEESSIPRRFMLSQPYPNPFNPTTTIEFSVAQDRPVTLVVYDLLGKEVMTLVDS